MSKWLLDYDNGDLLWTFEDGTAIDSKGNVKLRISDDLSVDLHTNEIHYTPEWEQDD